MILLIFTRKEGSPVIPMNSGISFPMSSGTVPEILALSPLELTGGGGVDEVAALIDGAWAVRRSSVDQGDLDGPAGFQGDPMLDIFAAGDDHDIGE